ncbi:MAG: OmpA family protein [Flavobacteriaceae bacterium]|nr:OmpA family protein [Flavobacteriaceae bacterium]
MKKILAIITLLLFLILLWYTKERYNTCCNDSNVVMKQEKPDLKVKKHGPLVYKWNSGEAITNDLWDAKKVAILSSRSTGKTLQILGPYFKDEGKEIGITRAKSAFAKLGNILKIENVEFGSKLIKYYDGAITSRFEGTEFNWLTRNENITEIEDKALIYFPTNSTKKLSNANIINYLEGVANSLKDNTKKVVLSGHTDSQGNAVINKKLALDRAISIKNELIRLGVVANRITTVSFGKEKPIADNNTATGMQKNRRVELEIK